MEEQHKEGYCLFCHKHTTVYPLKSWNDQLKITYFCDKHLPDAQNFELQSKKKFFEHFSNPEARSLLSEKQRLLWEKINEEFEGI